MSTSLKDPAKRQADTGWLAPMWCLGEQACHAVPLQVIHKEQYDEKREVLQEATTVDDMYDMLAVYEQKVVTADQVWCATHSAFLSINQVSEMIKI